MSTNEIQIVIKTPENAFLKAVEFNHEELSVALKQSLEKYDGLVFNDEQIVDAKATRAHLNKVFATMEAERKRVKSLCLQAYEPFDVKIKQLTGQVDDVNKKIDLQIKAYEKRQDDEKKAQILAFFNENIGDLKDVLPFEKVFNEKWLNAGSKLPKIQDEITAKFEQVRKDLQTLETLETEFIVELKDLYLDRFDIGAVLIRKHDLEERKATLEARKKQAEQSKPEPKVEPVKIEPVVAKSATVEPVKRFTFSFKVHDISNDEWQEVKAVLVKHGIKYERLD